MSDSEEEYEYDSYDEDEGDSKTSRSGPQECKGDDMDEGKQGDSPAQASKAGGHPGGSSHGAPPPGGPGGGEKGLAKNCADGEVRLLHMSDIVGPMQHKVAQIADLLDLPAAGAAALLRCSDWSPEKLTDRFWADAEKFMGEVGVDAWGKAPGPPSTVGTAGLLTAGGGGGSGAAERGGRFGRSHSVDLTGAGAQAGSEQSGGQASSSSSRRANAADNVVLGLPLGYHGIELKPAEGEVTCRVCYCDVAPKEALASPCGHFFCRFCYQEYLSTKLGEGPAVVFTTCPEHKCRCLVPPEIWCDALGGSVGDEAAAAGTQAADSAGTQASGGGSGSGSGGKDDDGDAAAAAAANRHMALLHKYSRHVLEQFVSSNKQLRWCPAPGCERVLMAGAGVANVRCGPGGCGAAFCFKCGEEAHQPTACEELIIWTEKCQNESETANWILANTKRCPKCTTRIEKNQGCNHMTCSQCKYEFCWMCMGNWVDHGANTGGYYKCNKFDPANSTDPDDAAGRAKRELDRYLHYFKRFQAHHAAQLFAEKQLVETEKRMGKLQESTGGSSWIDVQFLKTANEMVIECRRTLKFTYVFGYYLTSPKSMDNPEMQKHRDLFENMQEDLERYTELVSELTEMPLEKMSAPEHKESIINNTRVVEKFLLNLLTGCEEGLDAIGEGAVPLSARSNASAASASSSSSSAAAAGSGNARAAGAGAAAAAAEEGGGGRQREAGAESSGGDGGDEEEYGAEEEYGEIQAAISASLSSGSGSSSSSSSSRGPRK